MTRILDGSPIADEIRDDVARAVASLSDRGLRPTLATVLMSDDPADERFVALKHEACHEADIDVRDVRVDVGAPTADLLDALHRVSGDPGVEAVFLQLPLPDHVEGFAARQAIAPAKDVDCLHPRNLGRLVGGDPLFEPVTPRAIRRLLEGYDIGLRGRHVVIVGRTFVGTPLANMLLQKGDAGDATVTVCHSKTANLDEKTRRADVLVTAAGSPGLVDGPMLSEGCVVVDASANRVRSGAGHRVVGDVALEGDESTASAITPVPGGVGPVTTAVLLDNVTRAARRESAD